MAGDENLNQDDIEQLLAGNNAGDSNPGDKDAGGASAEVPAEKPDAAAPNDDSSQDNATLGQDDIEALLNGANNAPTPAPTAADNAALDDMLGQNEIENLLNSAKTQGAPAASNPPPRARSPVQNIPTKPPKNLFPEDGNINDGDVEYLLNQAEEAINSIRNGKSSENLPDGIQQFNFERFGGTTASSEMATLDMVKDVDLDLRIELGRTHMYLQDVLKLRNGSVVPLDKLAGDPVDIFVNGRLIAKGEVLVLNDNFCVRIAELIAGADAAG